MCTSWIGGGCIGAKIVAKNIIESKDHWRVTTLKKRINIEIWTSWIGGGYIYRCENRNEKYHRN